MEVIYRYMLTNLYPNPMFDCVSFLLTIHLLAVLSLQVSLTQFRLVTETRSSRSTRQQEQYVQRNNWTTMSSLHSFSTYRQIQAAHICLEQLRWVVWMMLLCPRLGTNYNTIGLVFLSWPPIYMFVFMRKCFQVIKKIILQRKKVL